MTPFSIKEGGKIAVPSKEGEGILLALITEFAPRSHWKVALENLTLVLMR